MTTLELTESTTVKLFRVHGTRRAQETSCTVMFPLHLQRLQHGLLFYRGPCFPCRVRHEKPNFLYFPFLLGKLSIKSPYKFPYKGPLARGTPPPPLPVDSRWSVNQSLCLSWRLKEFVWTRDLASPLKTRNAKTNHITTLYKLTNLYCSILLMSFR